MALRIKSIGHTIVVAGLMAAGKSTLIDMIKRGATPASLAGIVPEGASGWKSVLTRKLGAVEREHIEGLMVHAVLMGELAPRVEILERAQDDLFELAAISDSMSILTLWIPPVLALSRFDDRIFRRTALPGIPPFAALELDRQYRGFLLDSARVGGLYEGWIEQCARLNAVHWLIDASRPEYRTLPVSQWPQVRETLLADAWLSAS